MSDVSVFTADLPGYWPSGMFWAKVYFAETILLEDRFPFSRHGVMHRVHLNPEIKLTIPVQFHAGKTPVHNARLLSTQAWARKHAATIAGQYAWLPHFEYLFPEILPLYQVRWTSVSDFLFESIRYLKNIWRISATIHRSSDLWTTPLPDDYQTQWYQTFKFRNYVVYKSEKPYVIESDRKREWTWSQLDVLDAEFEEDLKKNSLFLLMKYGIEFPGLVRKNCRISKI